MFLTGEWLRERISQLEQKAKEATHGAIWVEEYMAVPAFGQIMVRFQTDVLVTLELIDQWEQQLQALAGNEFIIDFMGNIYREIGIDYAQLDMINSRLGQRFSEEPMLLGPYAEEIRQDAKELLRKCDLSDDLPVWEIQYEGGEYGLLLLGTENRFIRTVRGEPSVHLFEANGALCKGLQQAVFAAKRRGVSLGRLMLEAVGE